MCIDEEYFFDGDIDCQDMSDEQWFHFDTSIYCTFLPNLQCDETFLPSKILFSCGDGSFIVENSILLQENENIFCYLFRERQWMCELNDIDPMWTNPKNGHCLDFVDNATDIEAEEVDCLFILKCSLTRLNQHYMCPCTSNGCSDNLFKYCDIEDELISYPVDGVHGPFVRNIFDVFNHDFDRSRQPDYLLFIGSIKCNSGIRAVVNFPYLPSYDIVFEMIKMSYWYPLKNLLCKMYLSENPDKLIHGNCWNESYPNQALYCSDTHLFHCIPKKQIADGVADCVLGKF